MDDLFEQYFEYTGHSEVPITFHRWSVIGIVGALLARSVYIKFGHGKIYPNQYILLTGGPGARKGTAIRMATNLLKDIQYDYFAPNRAAKEALWARMVKAKEDRSSEMDELYLLTETIAEMESRVVSEIFIAQDEFVDFIGLGNDELIVNLTNLWDNLAKYDNPKTTKADVVIINPTVNMLSGSAPGSISEAFSGLALSGGFFSRVLFIFGGYTENKITWPTEGDQVLKIAIMQRLKEIRNLKGEIVLTDDVKTILDRMYKSAPGIPDRRFNYYQQRRFTHLLKLVIVCASANLNLTPTVKDCLLANTLLHLAELQMPYALGEYGKSKHSDVANSIMDIIRYANKPIGVRELWKQVNQDLDRQDVLNDILSNLLAAGRIQQIRKDGKVIGYLPIVEITTTWPDDLLDYTLLSLGEYHG